MSFIGFLFNTSRHNHQFVAVFIEAQTKEVSVNSTQMKNLCWENPHKSKLWRNSDCESEDRAKVTLIYSILEMAGEEVIQVKMRDPLRGTHKFFLLSEPVLSTQYSVHTREHQRSSTLKQRPQSASSSLSLSFLLFFSINSVTCQRSGMNKSNWLHAFCPILQRNMLR